MDVCVLRRVPREAARRWPARATKAASSPAEEGAPYCSAGTYIHSFIPCHRRFSTYFAAPSWQKNAVATYLAQANVTSGYNPYGRAYPDISLLGTNYQTIVGGKTYSLYGTSVTSPHLTFVRT